MVEPQVVVELLVVLALALAEAEAEAEEAEAEQLLSPPFAAGASPRAAARRERGVVTAAVPRPRAASMPWRTVAAHSALLPPVPPRRR